MKNEYLAEKRSFQGKCKIPPLLFVSRVDSKFVDFFVLSGAALKNIKSELLSSFFSRWLCLFMRTNIDVNEGYYVITIRRFNTK